MATKARRRKSTRAEEKGQFDVLFHSMLVLEAGDYRPQVGEFYLSNNFIELAQHATPARANEGQVVPGAYLGGYGDGGRAIQVVECLPVAAAKYERLKLLWRPLSNEAFPSSEQLCQAVVTTIDDKTGSVVGQRVSYRFNPYQSRAPWPAFPLSWLSNGQQMYRFSANGEQRGSAAIAGSRIGTDGICSMAPVWSAGCDFLRNRFWSVTFACEANGRRVRVFTSEAGVTGFFNLRDVSESGRRKALRHWVREHTRNIKPATKTNVIAHFRGQSEFRWFGFIGAVHAPRCLSQGD